MQKGKDLFLGLPRKMQEKIRVNYGNSSRAYPFDEYLDLFEFEDVVEFVQAAFLWDTSPEGFGYWYNIVQSYKLFLCQTDTACSNE